MAGMMSGNPQSGALLSGRSLAALAVAGGAGVDCAGGRVDQTPSPGASIVTAILRAAVVDGWRGACGDA